MQVLLCNLARY